MKYLPEFVESAIQHTQNGGNPEIQLLLTQYMHQRFGTVDPTDHLKL